MKIVDHMIFGKLGIRGRNIEMASTAGELSEFALKVLMPAKDRGS